MTTSITKNPIQQEIQILVVGIQVDGSGDLYGAHAIAKRVQNLMPEARITYSVTVPDSEAHKRHNLSEIPIQQVDPSLIATREGWSLTPLPKTLENFDLVIAYPSYADYLLPPILREHRGPFIRLRECGSTASISSAKREYSLGLGENECGVFLPLEQVHSPSQTTIPFNRETATSDELIDDILDKCSFHFAYFSHPITLCIFIKALQDSKQGNICVYIPKELPDKKLQWEELLSNFTEFSQYNLIDSKNFDDCTQIIKQGRKTRVCTLIFQPRREDSLRKLLAKSQKEALCTGDLSPFLCLEQKKVIFYEPRPHKQKFMNDLVQSISQYRPELKELISNAFSSADLTTIAGSEEGIKRSAEAVTTLFKEISRKKELQTAWNCGVAELFRNKDFIHALAPLLKDSLPQGIAIVTDPQELQKRSLILQQMHALLQKLDNLETEQKIALRDTANKNDLHLLVRRSATSSAANPLLDFLIKNRQILRIDLEAAGKTSGNALDLAIQYKNSEAETWLRDLGVSPVKHRL